MEPLRVRTFAPVLSNKLVSYSTRTLLCDSCIWLTQLDYIENLSNTRHHSEKSFKSTSQPEPVNVTTPTQLQSKVASGLYACFD